MNTTNTFAYSIDIYGLFEHPSTIEKALRPDKLVDYKWIPQTIADQVWVFYEFATTKEKNTYARAFKKSDRVRLLTLTDEQITYWE